MQSTRGLVVSGCAFDSNTTSWTMVRCDGGAVFSDTSSVTFTDCSFAGNHAANGAALHAATSTVSMTGCLFDGNIAEGRGGAVHLQKSDTLSARNITFVRNRGVGGAYWGDDTTVTASLDACILWDNDSTELVGTPTVDYSRTDTPAYGEGNLTVDPTFVNAGAGDFSLAADSPCRGTGKTASGAVCDMGGAGADRSALP